MTREKQSPEEAAARAWLAVDFPQWEAMPESTAGPAGHSRGGSG